MNDRARYRDAMWKAVKEIEALNCNMIATLKKAASNDERAIAYGKSHAYVVASDLLVQKLDELDRDEQAELEAMEREVNHVAGA